MRDRNFDTAFSHIYIECSGQWQGKGSQNLYNVKIICSLSCRPFIMTQSKNIPMTDPHFLHVQCNLNMHFGGGNKNHDYTETNLEILWDTMRSIYN